MSITQENDAAYITWKLIEEYKNLEQIINTIQRAYLMVGLDKEEELVFENEEIKN